MNKTLVSITISILAVLLLGLLVFNKTHRVDLPAAVNINTEGQPSVGQGKLTFVVFEDMKCSNCKRYNAEIDPYIQSHYIETGKGRSVVIPLAFINNSIPAGNAALCVYHQRPELYFSFVDYSYQHQPDEALDWATPELLTQYAQQIPGINVAAFDACVKNHTYYTQLEQNLKLAGEVMGNTVQTPSLYINGYAVNPLSAEQIDKVVNAVK